MAHLTVQSGALQGKVFPIDPGLTMGREAHNDIAMPDNKKSSRDHAKVWKSGPNRFEVADVGSTNGTFVNDDKITRSVLKDGDLIRVGDAEFVFELDEAEKPKAPPPKEKPSLSEVLRGQAKPGGIPAAQGAAAMEIKQRILQYSKKSAKGNALGVDVSQSAGVTRWVMIGVALAVAAGLFLVVKMVVLKAREGGDEPASVETPVQPGG